MQRGPSAFADGPGDFFSISFHSAERSRFRISKAKMTTKQRAAPAQVMGYTAARERMVWKTREKTASSEIRRTHMFKMMTAMEWSE